MTYKEKLKELGLSALEGYGQNLPDVFHKTGMKTDFSEWHSNRIRLGNAHNSQRREFQLDIKQTKTVHNGKNQTLEQGNKLQDFHPGDVQSKLVAI